MRLPKMSRPVLRDAGADGAYMQIDGVTVSVSCYDLTGLARSLCLAGE